MTTGAGVLNIDGANIMKNLIALLSIFAAFSMVGCAFKPSAADIYLDDQPAHVSGEKLFGYEKKDFDVKETLVERREKYDIIRVSFDAYHRDDPVNKRVTAWYYRQRTSTPTAGIIQLPILDGDYAPAMMFAEYYAEQGFHVLRMERKKGMFDLEKPVNYSRKIIIRSIIDERRTLDWWLENEEVDTDRIGISGISMGGFQASLLMAVDWRIDAGVFMLSGGDFPQLLMISGEGQIIEYRQVMKEKFDLTDEQMHEEAKKALADIDPMVFAPNLNPARVLFISPRFDQVVPHQCALKWWNAAGHPNMIVIPTGHYSSVFLIRYVQRKAAGHFKKVFEME